MDSSQTGPKPVDTRNVVCVELGQSPIIAPVKTSWRKCAAKNCKSTGRRLFSFPDLSGKKKYRESQEQRLARCKQWVLNCNNNDIFEVNLSKLNGKYFLCSDHFTDEQFYSKLRDRLLPAAVPSVFAHDSCPDGVLLPEITSRKSGFSMKTTLEVHFPNVTEKNSACQSTHKDFSMDSSQTGPEPVDTRNVVCVEPGATVKTPLVCAPSSILLNFGMDPTRKSRAGGDLYESGLDESTTVSVDEDENFSSDEDDGAGPSLVMQDFLEAGERTSCGLVKELTEHFPVTRFENCLHKKRTLQLISFCKLSDVKLKYFTGVEENEFKLLLDVVTIPAGFKACSEELVDCRDQFLLTLMKLRLNFDNLSLAHLFDISEKFVNQVVEHWIHRMYIALKGVNFWDLHEKEPGQYDVVIGCLEIPLETSIEHTQEPSTSDSDGGNMLKALIGVRESGAVVYCSSMWGGETSVRDILLDSDFLNYLAEGQHILADQTFNVTDILEKKKISLNIPSLRNVEQLRPEQAAVVQRIADRRKIVDKVISSAKEYQILTKPIPVKLLPICEEVVFVVANIMNFKSHLIESSNQ